MHDHRPTLSPYLVVADPDALTAFVVDVLGGVERLRAPGSGGGVHVELEIGDSVLMIGGSPAGSALPAMLHVYVDDPDGVYERALAAGAVGVATPADFPDGDRRGGFDDPWGNQWWVAAPSRG